MAKSGPTKEKPKAITIHVVKRTRRFIFIAYDKGDEVLTVRSNENPLPAFIQALEALGPLVGIICHLPKEYTAVNLRVQAVTLDTQGGARTVSITAQKSLDDAGKALKLVTPPRLLEHPTEEGSYTPPLEKDALGLVEELIEQAKEYVKGNRAQGTIPLDDEDDGEEDGDEGGDLPGIAGDNGGTGKPARKRTPSK